MSINIRKSKCLASAIFVVVVVALCLSEDFVIGEKITTDFFDVINNNILQSEESTLFDASAIVNEYYILGEEEEFNDYDYEDYDYGDYGDYYENYTYEYDGDYSDYENYEYEVSDEGYDTSFGTNEYADSDNIALNNTIFNYFDEEYVSAYDSFNVYDNEMEVERLIEYNKRGHIWPIPDEMYLPNKIGWINLMKKRFQQMERIPQRDFRYEGYYRNLISSYLVSNFTEYGLGITRCLNDNLMIELREMIYNGIDTADYEGNDPILIAPNPNHFIDEPELKERVLYELQSYAEEWSGIELIPYMAYGFRISRNESFMYMHTDRPHIISIILHIASSNDSQPWPLYVEDFDGNTNEIYLTSGDMLFYESSKIVHGRPKPFNGSWYTSVFLHYMPRYSVHNWYVDKDMVSEFHYAVPPVWINEYNETNQSNHDNIPKFEMADSAFTEPNCPNGWCGTIDTIKWYGPSENNILITPTKQSISFYPPENHYNDNDSDEEEEDNDDSLWADNFDRTDFSLTEEERVNEYHKRGYQWPIPDEKYVPNTPGWMDLMKRRLQQVERIPDTIPRYEGYYHTVFASSVTSNFTEHGFGLTRCMDEDLVDDLRQAIYDGIDTAPLEDKEEIIPGPNPPLFINREDLMERVVTAFQSYAETWSGIELIPYGAYGLRIYRNESELLMHIDRPHTHIISFIMHVASSEDSKPWPIFIEDYHGNTHEVILTSGDMLFYESSKLLHGRPKVFDGSWYCSVFVHYFPKYPTYHWNRNVNTNNEGHFAIPPIWVNEYNYNAENKTTENDDLPSSLVVVESGFTEPDCPNKWCGTVNTIQWNGPGEDNILITPTQKRIPFYPFLRSSNQGDHEEL